MKNSLLLLGIIFFSFTFQANGQAPASYKGDTTGMLKAEDERRYDGVLEKFFTEKHPEKYTVRALLAAGRIGDEKAVPAAVRLLNSGTPAVREMAAFALGEIGSINGADAVLKALGETNTPAVRARAVEAAGKIAAGNAKDAKAKDLGETVLDVLEAEDNKGDKQDRTVVRLALTAVLVARPEDGDLIVMKFLTNLDPRIRADAANTLSRIRSKIANQALRGILMSDNDPIARANAARALGAAEDKGSFDMLLVAATEDDDARVRVSAIRSLASLKDPMAVDKLLDRGEKLLIDLKRPKNVRPNETSELLEIATVLGRLVPNTNDSRTLKFLQSLRVADKFRSPETEIAFARISPKGYLDRTTEFIANSQSADWQAFSSMYQGLAILASLEPNELNKATVNEANFRLLKFAEGWFWSTEAQKSKGDYKLAIPDLLRALASRKSGNISGILGPILDRDADPIIRATAAELLANQPKSKENIEKLITAFSRALDTDKNENDAQLAILDALYKLEKSQAVGSLIRALNAPDYLVRKKAFELLADSELKEFPEIETAVTLARGNQMDHLIPHDAEITQLMSRNGTKLGQILNTDADYKRASSRKNGATKAVLTTQKGIFTIDLLPEHAPLTVDNFIKLARSRYFNGLEVHRVVPNFVMQDGDPRGDGNGGPGWSIRCEINMVPFDRGAVGMALSGKDTGGSQWFVTHSPQPHLDGGYTVFGRVNEKDMKVVDNIVRGDKIISVKIVEGSSTPIRRRK